MFVSRGNNRNDVASWGNGWRNAGNFETQLDKEKLQSFELHVHQCKSVVSKGSIGRAKQIENSSKLDNFPGETLKSSTHFARVKELLEKDCSYKSVIYG
jgi:hypothetical protein